jgi:predicted transcriptional regulator
LNFENAKILPQSRFSRILEAMEVHFTAEQEAQLAQLARHAGKTNAGELLKDTALRLLDEDARFRAAVLEGKAYADRGEFIEEEEMDARFEEMLRS